MRNRTKRPMMHGGAAKSRYNRERKRGYSPTYLYLERISVHGRECRLLSASARGVEACDDSGVGALEQEPDPGRAHLKFKMCTRNKTKK